mgnify:CR=1 FL=1
MPGTEHYREARDQKLEELREDLNPRRLHNLGAETDGGDPIRLQCLRWVLRLRMDPYEAVVLPDERPARVSWQVLALDYLTAYIPPPSDGFISFTDFSELRNYRDPFEGRVIRRLEGGAGEDREELSRAARDCGGRKQRSEPLIYDFDFFPLFTLRLVRHPGDEDLPPGCNVLFPENAVRLLEPESVIVAAESLVGCLEGKTPAEKG